MFKRSRARHKRLRKLLSIPALLVAVALSANSLAQSQSQLQYTRNTMELNRRSIIEVDPVTLALNLTIPLEEYAGRGVGLPATLHYSSKFWRVEYLACQADPYINTDPVTGIQYAENSESGWTSILDVPYVEQIGDVEPYVVRFTNGRSDSSPDEGKPWDSSCPPQPVCPPEQNCYAVPAQYYVRRARVHLPDGSSHEVRKGDSAVFNPYSLTGLYTAIDESGISYDDTTQTVFMPDGSRYLLNVQEGGTSGSKYVDRNGNTLFFSNSTQQWIDTLGRTFSNPLAVSQWTVANAAGGSSTYTFRWKYLRNDSTGTTVLTNPNNPADPDPWNPGLSTNPLKYAAPYFYSSGIQFLGDSLFQSGTAPTIYLTQSDTSRFNPYVLYEIVLPNQQKYRFTYNIFGEIDKVLLPTGGYKRYRYDWVPSRQYEYLTVYNQVNRGVAEMWESASGSGTDENHWQFSTLTAGGDFRRQVTGPDGTYSLRSFNSPDLYSSQVFGFNQFYGDVIDGRIGGESEYSAGGQLLRSHLYTWAFAGGPAQGSVPFGYPFPIPQSSRAPRLTRKCEILYDTTSGNPLAAVTEMDYDADLNLIRTHHYDYLSITLAQAQGSIPNGTLLRTDETTFLVNDPDIAQTTRDAYRTRGLIRLPSKQQVKDGAGTVVAATQFKYDENTLTTYSAVSSWTDPQSTYRGNVTTVREWRDYNYATEVRDSWVDWTSGTWIETRSWYDQCGSVVTTRNANLADTMLSYTDNFNAVPPTSTFAYPTTVTTPVPDSSGTTGSTSAFTTTAKYDYNTGLVVEVSDPNLAKTSHQYDALNRLTKTIRADQSQTVISYDDTNRWITTITDVTTAGESDSGSGLRSVVFLDGFGRKVRTATDEGSNNWALVEIVYDSLGRVSQTSNPFRITASTVAAIPTAAVSAGRLWTTTEYDALSRVKKVTTPDSAHVDTTYDGNKVTVTDQATKSRQSSSDAFGRLTQVVEDPGGSGFVTGYGYDSLGNLLTVTQGTQTRQFVYDSLSRLAKATNPENGVTKYEYDANGNLTKKTDARPIITTYGYDALNRVKSRSYSDTTPAVSYKYDGVGIPGGVSNSKGRLTLVSSSVSSYSYGAYDAMGRALTGAQMTDGQSYTISYGYDLAGNMTSETYPSGKEVRTSHDNAGRVASVSRYISGAFDKTYASSFSYAAHGAIASMTLGNNLVEATTFNNRLQPTFIKLGTTSNPPSVLQLGYEYTATCQSGNNGNVLRQTITAPGLSATQDYCYDALNRLSSASENSGVNWSQTYGYDRYGNRWVSASTGYTLSSLTPTSAGAFNTANNQLYASLYDAAGNQTGDAQSRSFTYDGANRQITFNGTTAQYFYDGDGHRVKKMDVNGTTVFVYNVSGQLIAEYTSGPPLGGGTSYLTNDHLGSTRVVTKSDGSVKARYDYLPFGEEIPSTVGSRSLVTGYGGMDSTRQKFTQKERDSESGLDYFGARYYSSPQGRFTSVDPYNINLETQMTTDWQAARSKVIAYLSYPQQWNRYPYVTNNPLKYVDPYGELLEIFGSEEERKKALERIKGVVGEKAAALLYVREDNGHYYVDYKGKDRDALAATSELGVHIADIIDSDKTVEFHIAKGFSTTSGNHSVNAYGGAATVGSEESLTGNTQIFVHPDAGNVAQEKLGSTVLAATRSSDGRPLDFYNDIVDAHEFGHAYANVKWGIPISGSEESYPYALRMENYVRARRHMPNRRIVE